MRSILTIITIQFLLSNSYSQSIALKATGQDQSSQVFITKTAMPERFIIEVKNLKSLEGFFIGTKEFISSTSHQYIVKGKSKFTIQKQPRTIRHLSKQKDEYRLYIKDIKKSFIAEYRHDSTAIRRFYAERIMTKEGFKNHKELAEKTCKTSFHHKLEKSKVSLYTASMVFKALKVLCKDQDYRKRITKISNITFQTNTMPLPLLEIKEQSITMNLNKGLVNDSHELYLLLQEKL
jgi:hypothetical protein